MNKKDHWVSEGIAGFLRHQQEMAAEFLRHQSEMVSEFLRHWSEMAAEFLQHQSLSKFYGEYISKELDNSPVTTALSLTQSVLYSFSLNWPSVRKNH